MIFIRTDEGYAFDYLAILQIKLVKLEDGREDFDECKEILKNQIGIQRFREIYSSGEYTELLKANLATFNAVEKARYGEITAKEVDDCNMRRYHAKVALQKKFFPTQKQVEKKS